MTLRSYPFVHGRKRRRACSIMDVFWSLAMGDLIMFRQMGFGVAVALLERRDDRARGAGEAELVPAGLAPLACPG